MRCLKHSQEAVAVCAYCGRALCVDCVPDADTRRMTCSTDCADALARTERGIEAILEKSVQNARATAMYCYVLGLLSAGTAVGAWFVLPSPILIWFTGASAVGLILSGFWYGRIAKKSKL